VHAFNSTIDWRVVARLALGSIPASLLTMAMFQALKLDPGTTAVVITRALGAALLATAAALLFRERLLTAYARRVGVLNERQTIRFTVIAGAFLGALVTVSSVGAGALGVTALILLYPELPVVRIAGSGIAHAVPLTLVAGLGHLMNRDLDVTMLVSLLAGSLPGVLLASLFAPRLPGLALRLILAATLVVSGLRLLVA
jgi:uncharacterized membrane protein YfcA